MERLLNIIFYNEKGLDIIDIYFILFEFLFQFLVH